MFTRRDFLRSSSLIALAPAVPAFLAQTARAAPPDRDARTLVVLQLDGGNDGLNTVAPFADETYRKLRPFLALPKDRVLKIDDQLGFNPSMGDMAKLLEAQKLAIVQAVGYPNPSRSHARSMAIWQSARPGADDQADLGWLGRALEGAPKLYAGAPASLFLGVEGVPVALRSRAATPSALAQIDDFHAPSEKKTRDAVAGPEPKDDLTQFVRRSLLDGYLTSDWLRDSAATRGTGVKYSQTELGNRLEMIAQLIKAGLGARVFYTTHPGYDTHSNQLAMHGYLLGGLSAALKTFLDDLAAAKADERVAVLIFSEFGRRVAENNGGTDHGAAGLVFLAGPKVKAGLVGKAPSLTDLDNGDLKMGIDFRQVYATVLEDWLSLPSKPSLAGTFERLPLFKA